VTARVDLDQVVAQIPYVVGYEMGPDHVVAQLVDPGGQLGTTLAFRWPADADQVTAAEHFASTVADIAQRDGAATMLVVAYGPHARARAEAVADATESLTALPSPVLAHVDLETNQFVSTRHGEPWWRAPRQLPDTRAEAVLAGLQAPAATREDLAARVAPLPAAAFTLPSAEAAAHAADLEPSKRAAAAVRVVDLLATNPHGSAPLDHGRSDSAMSTLAVMMTSHRAVRDAVLVHAAEDSTRVDALVRTFRAAPPELRSGLAAAAGAALYLNGQQTALVDAVLKHVDPTSTDVRLADLVQTAAGVGLNPHHLVDTLRTAGTEGLQGADAAWHLARRSASLGASFPDGVRGAGQAAGTAAAVVNRPGPATSRGPEQRGAGR